MMRAIDLHQAKTTQSARKQTVEDTVERLAHSRRRKDLASAYLG
jgi:hypothetical protein